MKANADKKTIIGKRNSIDNEKDCPVPEKKLKAIADNKPKKSKIIGWYYRRVIRWLVGG